MRISSKIFKSIVVVFVVQFLFISLSQAKIQSLMLNEQNKSSDDSVNQLISRNDLLELVDIVNKLQLENDVNYEISSQSVNDSCQKFMSADYDFGFLGKTVFNTLDRYSNELYRLIDGGELASICPRYKDNNLEEKSRVWVMVLALMAHFESSCNPNIPARGPNGQLYGLFQLHKYNEAFYDGSSRLCEKNASLNAQKSVVCTLSMLNMQYEKQNMMLFAPGSYWDVLRMKSKTNVPRKAKLIKKAIQKSSLCSAVST